MHEKGRDDAKQQKDHYRDAGFFMLADRATWDGSSNSVEQGIYEIRDRMQKGTFKVFSSCRDFFDEFMQYHRDDKGKIVKVRDDVLDAVRYAYMMRRYAKSYGDIMNPNNKRVYIPKPIKPMGRKMMELDELKRNVDKDYQHNQVTREQSSDDLVFYHVTQWDDNYSSTSQLQF